MARTYYTLCTREQHDELFAPQFGAYNKADVEAERSEMVWNGAPPRNIKIVKSGARQADINAAVAKLNGAA